LKADNRKIKIKNKKVPFLSAPFSASEMLYYFPSRKKKQIIFTTY